jgi:hypothetical protein
MKMATPRTCSSCNGEGCDDCVYTWPFPKKVVAPSQIE